MQLRVKLLQEIRGALLLKSEIKHSRKDRPGLSIPLREVRLRQAKGKRPPECNLRQKALRRAPPVRVRPKSHPHLDVTRVALRKGVPPSRAFTKSRGLPRGRIYFCCAADSKVISSRYAGVCVPRDFGTSSSILITCRCGSRPVCPDSSGAPSPKIGGHQRRLLC
jgi:hypothetical protein